MGGLGALNAGDVAGLLGKGLAVCLVGFRIGFAGGHFAQDEAGEGARCTDAEARIGMAYLLAQAVDERGGVGRRTGLGD